MAVGGKGTGGCERKEKRERESHEAKRTMNENSRNTGHEALAQTHSNAHKDRGLFVF